MLMLDFRIGLALWGGMFPIFLMFMANGAASLPAEKAKFTWEVFFPKVVDRFMLAYNEFDGAEATNTDATGPFAAAMGVSSGGLLLGDASVSFHDGTGDHRFTTK